MARVQRASSVAYGLPTTGWRGLLLGVTIVHLLNGVALTILAGTLYPTYVVFPVLWIIGILRLRRGDRAGLLWLGITGLAFLLLHLPLTLPELSNPTQLFVPTVIYNLASVLTIVAAVLARRDLSATKSGTAPASA